MTPTKLILEKVFLLNVLKYNILFIVQYEELIRAPQRGWRILCTSIFKISFH